MYDRILFPTDGSAGAGAVTDHVLDIASRHDAVVHVLNVADTAHDSVTRLGSEVVDVLVGEGEQIVSETADRAERRGVPTVTAVHQGRVPETVVEYATLHDVDLIVMPTRGRTGVERVLLGSVTERVLRQAPVPVLTLNPDGIDAAGYPYRSLLVATDGSACAEAALDAGIDLAESYGATLHLLSVVDITSLGVDIHSTIQVEELERQAEADVEEARETAASAGVDTVRAVEHGTAVHRVIGGYAEENGVDLVVMGTHGRSGLDRVLLGSVAEKTVRTAPVPVMTVSVREEAG
jgi:nucleotide-binding universal stress UspA family protein